MKRLFCTGAGRQGIRARRAAYGPGDMPIALLQPFGPQNVWITGLPEPQARVRDQRKSNLDKWENPGLGSDQRIQTPVGAMRERSNRDRPLSASRGQCKPGRARGERHFRAQLDRVGSQFMNQVGWNRGKQTSRPYAPAPGTGGFSLFDEGS